MTQFLITGLVLIAFSVSSQARVYYVLPDNSSSSCPGQPCLTLDQYASQQTKYFTAGSAFMFLSGNHTCNSTVLLHNTSNISLRAMESNRDVTVLCQKTAGLIQFRESVNLTIQGVTFVLTGAADSSSIINTVHSKDIMIINSGFLGNSGGQVHAMHCNHSGVAIVRSKFVGNSGDYGGAIFAEYCNLTVTNNTFKENTAENYGGAIATVRSKLAIDSNVFNGNRGDVGGAVYAEYSNLTINNNSFNDNTAKHHGGAIAVAAKNSLTIESNVFTGNSGDVGGAVYAIDSSLTLNGNVFYKNNAQYYGGAVFSSNGSLLLKDKLGGVFEQNSATVNGGGVNCDNSTCFIESDNVNINSASIPVANSSVELTTGVISFNGQEGFNGGAVFITDSTFSSNARHLHFTGNVAMHGSGIYSWNSNLSLLSADFTHNMCFEEGYGGAIFSSDSNVSLHDFNATKNCRAVATVLSTVTFSGNVTISRNYGVRCGGVITTKSSTYFTGHTVFERNLVVEGGGAVCTNIKSTLFLSGTVLFKGNLAIQYGGAIYAFATTAISIGDNVSFIANSAGNGGGAMFFENGARLILKQNLLLTLANNHAGRFGGALYYSDLPTLEQCYDYNLPISCFIEFFSQTSFISFPYKISARNNSADEGGGFLFGGLLDKCEVFISASITSDHSEWKPVNFYPIFLNMTAELSDATLTQEISSQPYKLCFCDKIHMYTCTGEKTVIIQRGGKFTVPLVALAQGDAVVSSLVRAKVGPTARLQPDQRLQHLERNCTSLQFNMYSSQEQEQLILYVDEGPCLDNGLSRVVISAIFLPCPDGFTLSGDKCVCEERLQKYQAYCTICDEGVFITKKAGSTFWLSPLNSSNETYLGLVLCPTCPTQYCKIDYVVNISLIDPNIQCAHNHSGVLCGACAANYSLTFGSSRCEICSNTNLALLLVFAAAGIVLVVFLTLLRLTVATGMINSVILYANIVQTNKDILFPNSSAILKVFIAWMNFDFGFQTCFYNGMDAYVQTWLQFAFPLYVWILVSLIILASRYSITVTKLIGSNPIAVLATLLLMSYAKLLKIIIEVYSSVDLEYPGNKTMTVWLKDANELYLQSRHLVLTVVTTLLLAFLFLPYTLLLLLGYKLYRFTGRRYTHWLTKIKPLLDSYYAPYKMHTRFWTGLLLLVRCALYIMFSYNSLGHTTRSLLVIIIAFAAIIVLLTVKIYLKLLRNTLEGVVYFNLIVLCAVALAEVHSPVLVNSLIGMVFFIMIGIIIYHFHILYIAKSALWLKLRVKIAVLRTQPTEATPLLAPVASGASHQRTLAAIATRREPSTSVLST